MAETAWSNYVQSLRDEAELKLRQMQDAAREYEKAMREYSDAVLRGD